MLENIFGLSIARSTEEAHGAPDEFVGVAKLATVLVRDVWQPHEKIPIAHRRRSAVGHGGCREES
eukprot:6187302-Pleurochrysis_carterae.AAC.4